MTPEQLHAIKQKADSALTELVDLINHTPHLAAEIGPLMKSADILMDFQAMMADKPDVAEQLLRLALATTVNYNTSVETSQQLAKAGI